MHKMTNLEYSFMANELAPLLVGKHLRRIRKLDEGVYRLKIGDHELICQSGVRIHITRRLEPSELKDKFSEKAEKELDNAKLISLEQVNQDRILSFGFDKGKLIFEMFGDGNIILVRDDKTVCAEHYETWADRSIKAGEEYKPPKTSIPDSEDLALNDRYVIVSLTKLPLGKDYAIEALARAGIPEKTPGASLTKDQISRLKDEIRSIRTRARPTVFIEKDREGRPAIRDFALTGLSVYKDLEGREMPTLSEAADEYYSGYEKPNPEKEKLQKRLEKQKERLLELESEEKQFKEKGDFIYSHYQEVEGALNLAKEGKFDELEKIRAIKINKKDKSIETEI